MEILGNGFHWQKWMSLLLLTCAVLAYRTLDNPGYTRQFIARFDHDCRDFNGVLSKCHVWKDLGFCFKYRREMQHVCNKTCQYCVPGQKQWKIIDRVWGRVKDSAGQTVGVHDRDSAPVIQHKGGPSIQILGKERTPQVETASNAIATQLERGAHQDSQASPSVLGWLPKVRAGLQSTIAPARIKSETTNEETKEKLLTPQLTPPTTAVDQDQSGESINRQASISGKTQVRVSSKETDHRPVVVLMGYELGEKSSKKVHEVLKNSDSAEISASQSVNTSVPQRQHDYGLIALGRKNSNGTASTSTDNIASEYKDADSELEKVAEFLGNATTTGKRKHDKRPVHERKKILYVNASTLHSKLHAGSLNSPVTSASGNTTMEKAEKLKSQKEAILPISSDDIVNQQAIERVKSSASHTHHYKNNDMHEQQYQGIENGYLMPNSLGGMRAIDLSGTMMDAPLRKPKPPYYAGKQVTVTFNEKPKTEETFKQSPPPNNFHAKENEEDIDKSEEEKIRMATQSIKNVLKLFGNDYRDHHEKLKLVTQSAKDLPAHSKSLEIHRELAGIQREIDTQTQSQDRSAENAQAISRQIGQELTTNESGNRMTNVPNYAVISTKGSKDWKNLAHVLAIQLKGVLNHMENREKENQYEKDRMEEEMMMMAQQQDEDDDPDYDGDYYDDDDMNERRHSVLMPLATNSSKKAFKKFILENKRPHRLKYESSVDEKRLLHQDVKTLSKLEMLYKSQERNSSNHE